MLRVPQDQETPVQTVHGESFDYRFAYARAADIWAANDIGQDYLVVDEQSRSFVFALCDGVSQSFFGNIAARHLGDALSRWLRDSLANTMDPDQVRAALAAHLHDLVGLVTEQVKKQVLPADMPAMLRQVLEEKRSFGSESTFVCGRIDLPGEMFPHGRVVLAWMGDSRLRLWTDRAEATSKLGGVFETFHRWSSRRGLVEGKVNVFVSPLVQRGQRYIRLVAYSDGLSVLDTQDLTLSGDALQELVAKTRQSPTSDDISYLDVSWALLPASDAHTAGSTPEAARARPSRPPAARVPLPQSSGQAPNRGKTRVEGETRTRGLWALVIPIVLILSLVLGALAWSADRFILRPCATKETSAPVSTEPAMLPATPTRTPLPTPKSSPTGRPTSTLTVTPTSTKRATPTADPVLVSTETATVMPTVQVSPSLTITTIATASAVPTGTAALLPTPLVTVTLKTPITGTETPTVTTVLSTATPTGTPAPTATVTPTGTLEPISPPELSVMPSPAAPGMDVTITGAGLTPGLEV